MAVKETIKNQAREMTTPHVSGTAGRPVVHGKMGLSGVHRKDPIDERIDRDDMEGGTSIDNTGRGILRIRNPFTSINDKYETAAEKEAEERAENGGITEEEEERVAYYKEAALEEYYEELEEDLEEERYSAYWDRAYGEDSLYAAGESSYGLDGEGYVAIYDKESGELMYYDNETSCVNPNAAVLGGEVGEDYISTLAAKGDAINDDLIDEGQQYSITYKVEADGTVTERTDAEKQFQTTLTRMDNEATKLPLQLNMVDRMVADASQPTPAANDPSFTSAAEPIISTQVSATSAFNTSAATPPSTESTPTAAPSVDAPAANDPIYRANGTTGPSAAPSA